MTKKKRKKANRNVPIRVRLLALTLILVFLAGVGAVKLFKTTRGKIILLDAGFVDYYSMVQWEVDGVLRGPVESLGLDASLKQRIQRTEIHGKKFDVLHWEATCVGECSPAKIGLAFVKAAKQKGALARSRILDAEKEAKETILITVGSRRYETHVITVRRSESTNEPRSKTEPKPRVAIVIDDFGYSRNKTVESFLALNIPVTVAVLPSLPRTQYVLTQAQAAGKETMLHLPMEAENGETHGTAVATAMDDDSIRNLVERHLDGSVGIVGVNNHQGSLATRDRRVMLTVISVIKNYDLFFLDSLTSSESIAYNTAKSLEVPTARNSLFLDDDTEDQAVVEDRLRRLADVAHSRGRAIGIAHPKPWTLAAIVNSERMFRESGVELVFVSELVE